MLRPTNERTATRRRGERGQVLIWVAFFFIVFLAAIVIVADVGYWLWDRREAQNDADAMALAAAQELPDTAPARAIAYEWAAANDVPADQVERIEFEDGDGNLCTDGCSLVRVYVKRDSSILMGQVLDIFTATVRVKAAAALKPLSGACPFPWAIPAVNPAAGAAGLWGLTPGTGFVFQEGPHDESDPANTPGNFGALAVLGNGDRVYRDTINGTLCGENAECVADETNVCYDTLCGFESEELLLAPGDTLSCSTQTGALGRTTLDALQERYAPNADDECDAQSYTQAATIFNSVPVCREGTTSRLGGIFIIDAFPPTGQSVDAQVLGIAWFYISGWDRWSPVGNGDLDGAPSSGYVWGYITDKPAADIWNLEGLINPFAPVVAVLVE